MSQILTMNRKLRRDVRGVTAIEYGLLVALIIIACIAALSLTGTNAKKVFVDLGNAISATFTPVDAFGSFVANEEDVYFGGCSTSGYTRSGFQDSSGDVISTNACSDSYTQSQLFNTLDSAGSFDVSNASDSKITIPPAGGAGTGFSISNGGHDVVKLFTQRSGNSRSFFVYFAESTRSVSDINSITAACTAEGGTVSTTSSYAYCNGGKLYSNNLASQLIPSSAQ